MILKNTKSIPLIIHPTDTSLSFCCVHVPENRPGIKFPSSRSLKPHRKQGCVGAFAGRAGGPPELKMEGSVSLFLPRGLKALTRNAMMIGSPRPAPASALSLLSGATRSSCSRRSRCVLFQKLNIILTPTQRGGCCHYPHLPDEEINGGSRRLSHLAKVIISSRGRIRTGSACRELRGQVRAVFVVGGQGTLRASGEALEPGFLGREDFLSPLLAPCPSFFPSDSESPFSSACQGLLVPLWFASSYLLSSLPSWTQGLALAV